ncbi:vimentin [Antennarius striatus]|uniref:vimentin n=1 Tax=Antennarius striatus TaxID=241820 RepID=UPI0035B2D520
MAVIRVSSYRKLFEDDHWRGNVGLSARCAGQYQASIRAADKRYCENLDFATAKKLNIEGLNCFLQDRIVITSLNDRLVRLIELARCFEEENESLECQIDDLEEKLYRRKASFSNTSAAAEPESGLDAVVENLRRERDEILNDTEELRKELECLMKHCENATHRRTLLQREQQNVAEAVDGVTAGCLALREQVSIYEKQLDNMEAQKALESLLEPVEGITGALAAIKYGSPDIAPALDVKEFYCQLAERLKFDCGATSSAVVCNGYRKQLDKEGAVKSKDISEMKMMTYKLQKKLAVLEKYNNELEEEFSMRNAAYADEIAELESTIDEMQHQEAKLKVQMKEQCEDYKELLSEKMARDMEIAAYRSLVEEEEERLSKM